MRVRPRPAFDLPYHLAPARSLNAADVSSIPPAAHDNGPFTNRKGKSVRRASTSKKSKPLRKEFCWHVVPEEAHQLLEDMRLADMLPKGPATCGIKGYKQMKAGCTDRGHVAIKLDQHGRAFVSGIRTCKSVHPCPVCMTARCGAMRREFTKAAEWQAARGGRTIIVTLTSQHRAHERCFDVLSDICKTWSRVTNHRGWRKLLKGQDGNRPLLEHYCRVLETVNGTAGWHPHFHVLLLVPALSPEEEQELRTSITQLWIGEMQKLTGGRRAPLAEH